MENRFSERVSNIEESKSIYVSKLVAKMLAEGKDVISLCVGEPDFSTPENIKIETKKAIDDDYTKYSLVAGIPTLRDSIAKSSSKEFGKEISAEQVMISNGSKQILFNIFQTICNPGDEVIVPTPYWVSYPESIKLAGGSPVFVKCQENHHLDINEIRNAIGPKTKAVVINSPNNPSGAVFSKTEIEELSELCQQKGIFLISDEAYDALVYDCDFYSPFSISSENNDHIISVKTFSKTYCMTGFRVGYSIASKGLTEAMTKFQGHLCGNVAPFIQKGAEQALKTTSEEMKQYLETFKKRRDLTYSLYKDTFTFSPPEGAFYLFGKMKKEEMEKFKTSENFCMQVLEKAGVAILPGTAFGMEGYIRISFANSEENLKKSFERIDKFLKE